MGTQNPCFSRCPRSVFHKRLRNLERKVTPRLGMKGHPRWRACVNRSLRFAPLFFPAHCAYTAASHLFRGGKLKVSGTCADSAPFVRFCALPPVNPVPSPLSPTVLWKMFGDFRFRNFPVVFYLASFASGLLTNSFSECQFLFFFLPRFVRLTKFINERKWRHNQCKMVAIVPEFRLCDADVRLQMASLD